MKTTTSLSSLTAMLLCTAACTTLPPQSSAARIEVSKDCGARPACFATLTGALQSVDASDSAPVRINIGPGEYEERVVIGRSNLTIQGAGRDSTVLHNDLVAENAGPYHRDGWGTAGSATLTLAGQNIRIAGLTIENGFDYLANDALPDSDPRKIGNSQALAVLLDETSDMVLLRDVALLGYQDTLFAHGGRAVVRDSLIAGNVDFIFGDGQLLIEDSEIRSRPRSGVDSDGFQSYIAAPSTQLSQPVGIVFRNCRLTREDGVPDGSVALARPWHPTTRFPDGRYADPRAVGMAVFADCWMDAHIAPAHWTSMAGTARDGTKTDIFRPQDSRFWETGSTGPGARREEIGIAWRPAMTVQEMSNVITRGWAAD
ncbi:pectinesterase family protein [Erythrobacter sp. LQ02-29]|uniref:pectinesterase family protein n=1 Tax=Erythrobacter sp. LQ02-29 TaxID=2920384 RepID=UPI001F4DA3D7|nr:pectinesterase family protein [Erythrobacter sp. LQ02-29]MCP9221207.1 pectinesterase family protein [Erythrobacter sp. LQ02-29]